MSLNYYSKAQSSTVILLGHPVQQVLSFSNVVMFLFRGIVNRAVSLLKVCISHQFQSIYQKIEKISNSTQPLSFHRNARIGFDIYRILFSVEFNLFLAS